MMSSNSGMKSFISKDFLGLAVIFFVILNNQHVESTRIARAVMMSVAFPINLNCTDSTIMRKNSTSNVILTGTVANCYNRRAGSYKCRLQIWRVMKGKNFTSGLSVELASTDGSYKKMYIDVYGLGNTSYCESNVKALDTRIFFLNRVNDRLVLSASLLRITLSNLQNTQAVADGRKIVEKPKKPLDPCLSIICGYGAHCEVIKDKPNCVCPDITTCHNVFAPVCGSNGVTYPNECRLKDDQCLSQKRIKIESETACELDCDGIDRDTDPCINITEPVVDDEPCDSVRCGYYAQCVIQANSDGVKTPTCVCPTCNGVPVSPVCGSNQMSFESECEMQRMGCREGIMIEVVRNSTCSPCQVFNETYGGFDQKCDEECVANEEGAGVCCSDVECQAVDLVCGSDGNTYESECALKRYACKTTRTISILHQGRCPDRKPMTEVIGSIRVHADNCPGNCTSSSSRFRKFLKKMESSVNKMLKSANNEDIDARLVKNFEVLETRSGSVVIVFKALASTNVEPIGYGSNQGWIYERLIEDSLLEVVRKEGLVIAELPDPATDLFIEDVCLDLQCHHGEVCSITLRNGELRPSCGCASIGIGGRMAVDMACKLASDGDGKEEVFANMEVVRENMCRNQAIYTFRDTCYGDSPVDHCASIGGCEGSGQVCVLVNGEGRCECMTCNDQYEPVCASDGQTYRSVCEMFRQNCLMGKDLYVRNNGACESKCDDVKCRYGAQCEMEAEGTVCVCPRLCTKNYSPVCASDCETYNNECEMVVAGCKNKQDLTVIYAGTCDGSEECVEGSGSEKGSGGGECQCKYGATCDGTMDDEDAACICSFSCSGMSVDVICGSDGVTYTNECERQKAQCEAQRVISVIRKEPCGVVCKESRYGCCEDGITSAKGPAKAGCPETCSCNQHGSYGTSCDVATGQCVCRPGVGGLRCDRCKPGFWNFRGLAENRTTGCMACRCDDDGSTRDDCDQMSGKCRCKKGVKGAKCTECEKDGSRVNGNACQDAVKVDDVIGARAGSRPNCEELDCRPEQECVDDGAGAYRCRCPQISSCDAFVGASICGSDGVSYPDTCQMKVMACKKGVSVSVVSEGACRMTTTIATTRTTTRASTITTTAAPTTTPTLPITTTTTISLTTTLSSTSLPPPSTSSMLAETSGTKEDIVHPPVVDPGTDETDGSGMTDCAFSDDEDCMGSGGGEASEETDPTKTDHSDSSSNIFPVATASAVDSTSSLEQVQAFNAEGDFYLINGTTLDYESQLSNPESDIFQQYSDLIESVMMEYAEDPSLAAMINAISVTSFTNNYSFWYGTKGVKVAFVIYLNSGFTSNQVQQALNRVTDDQHSFVIKKEAGKTSVEIPEIEVSPYNENAVWTSAQFGGFSYAEYPQIDALTLFTVGMKFRSFDSEGLLFFATQRRTEGDFVSLAVREGKVEFRFDIGSGVLVLTNQELVNDSRWHDLVARRNRRDGVLMVDHQKPIRGISPPGSTGLSIKHNIYVGGFHPDVQNRIRQRVQVDKGLTGCISSISLQDKNLPLQSGNFKNRVTTHRLAACGHSPCYPNPCQNSANCFISKFGNSYMNKCECKHGFSGDLCNHENNSCASLECHPSSSCALSLNGIDYICSCAAERSGKKCEIEKGMQPEFMPGFAEDSYLIREPMGDRVKTKMTVEVVMYSSQSEGLIFYNAEKKSGRGDFVALYMKDHYLFFIYNLGGGMVKIRSHHPISLNQWHDVRVSRNKRVGEMSVDGERTMVKQSPNDFWQLTTKQPLYLGGFPHDMKRPPHAGIETGLTGAIQKFVVNGVRVPLDIREPEMHYNVREFNAHSCYHTPCYNEGTCLPYLGEYTCLCAQGWSGRHCEQKDG